jgi:hypothetical protein
MSEVSIDYAVKFDDHKISEAFKNFLSSHEEDKYNHEKSKLFLDQVGVDSAGLYNSDGIDSDISEVSINADGEVRFQINGGVWGGTEFAFELQRLLYLKTPKYIYARIFNDQVGEYTIFTLKDGRIYSWEAGPNYNLLPEYADLISNGDLVEVVVDHYEYFKNQYKDHFDDIYYAEDQEKFLEEYLEQEIE